MRVKQISVKNLFGVFDHSIPLNLEERITIIHGPNGFGKTALLRLIDGLFNSGYSHLRSIPFTEFCVEFDNRSSLRVDKSPTDDGGKLELLFHEPRKEELSFVPKFYKEDEQMALFRGAIEIAGGLLERIGREEWRYLPTGEIIMSDEVIARFGDILPSKLIKPVNEPSWLKNLKKNYFVRFIQTQRLLSPLDARRASGFRHQTLMRPTVEEYSKELASVISTKLAESVELSQSLDRSFPVRLVAENAPTALSTNELHKRLSELEKKRVRLTAAGLLDKDSDAAFQMPTQIDETKRSVLSVYVNDVEKKLGVFDDMADRIELFRTIVNRRFLYKQMTVNRERGFIFTTTDDKPLPPSALSSGEQHELVLLYELLFKIKSGSLILIDEPELSLHVAWQQQFLEDLQEITKLSSIDVLIATHSPSIIHDRWDLTVELKGPAR